MTALPTPPASAGTCPEDRSGLQLLRRLRTSAEQLAIAEVSGTAAETAELVGQINAMMSAYQGRAVRAFARHEAEAHGAGNPAQYLARKTRQDAREVNRQTQLAEALAGATATEAALGKGRITDRHAQVITGALRDLPRGMTPQRRQAVERELVGAATRLDPNRLRREAKRALAVIEPDPTVVDEHEDALLTAQEDAALEKTWLTMYDLDDGTTQGHFLVPTTQAHMLRKVIHAMAAPRRHRHTGTHSAISRGRSGSARPNGSGSNGQYQRRDVNGSAGDIDQDVPTIDFDHIPHTGSRDTASGSPSQTTHQGGVANRPASDTPAEVWAGLSWKQRYGRAFAELLTHIPCDHLHDKAAATLVVHLDHEHLQQDVAKAVDVDTAHRMSGGQLRRTACEAGILPAVYNGASVPLDLGRANRFFTSHQRLLLAQRYRECAADGCDRPFAWTETHHIEPWTRTRDSSGGPTDLANALPLCSHHHHLIHHRGYSHELRAQPMDESVFTTATSTSRRTPRSTPGTTLPTYTVTYRRRP